MKKITIGMIMITILIVTGCTRSSYEDFKQDYVSREMKEDANLS